MTGNGEGGENPLPSSMEQIHWVEMYGRKRWKKKEMEEKRDEEKIREDEEKSSKSRQ